MTEKVSARKMRKESGMGAGSVLEIFFPFNLDVDRDRVYVASFPKIIYMWPTIVALVACGLIQMAMDVEISAALGWVFIGVFSVNWLIIAQDFPRLKFFILVLMIALIILLIWVINLKGITLLEDVQAFLKSLNPGLTDHTYIIMFVILSVLFLWGITSPLVNHWRFENNEFIHFVRPFGRDQSIPRMGHSVTMEVSDVFEFILCGAASIVIKQGPDVVARIENVPFAPRKMRVIDKIIGELKVKQAV
jgi:hypothetical protein